MATALPIARPLDPTDADADAPLVEPTRPRSFLVRAGSFVGSVCEWCFGAASLWLGLSLLAAVPVGQFLALGYLLESSGRVARSGRIRDGFVGVWKAARLGGIALALGVMWLPLYFISIENEAARIVDPSGRIARQWETALTFLAVFFVLHACGALLAGGRLRHFLNPLSGPWFVVRLFSGGLYSEARDRVWATVVELRLPYYFWLGVRGFAGALMWLVGP
ncbi:MAG: hypothetical protein K2V38_03000, partial [Gemmataceae bacterium]|nr:hypothetical protein [Gemmataceae bacterium]